METPIYDFLKKYSSSGTLRCHMPGHKGIGGELPYDLDITEITGADSLFEADGIILRAEKNTSHLYGTAASFFSAGGSTLCIQAMLAAMKFQGRTVVAVRNVHRAFLNAAALLDLDVRWILPDYTDGILSGRISLEDTEKALASVNKPCLYVTSPDYTGRLADIPALAEICRRYGAPLLVDNAHGAHLRFFPESLHPISLGADICCDSAHKMLPALTGAAFLHTSRAEYGAVLRQCMSLFASTSPSYLIMCSLDLCNKYLAEKISVDIGSGLERLKKLRGRFSDRLFFAESEPFHITVRAAESGYDGNELAALLRKNGVECEYSDCGTVILLMSPVNTGEDFRRLGGALEKSLDEAEKHPRTLIRTAFVLPERAMSVREAVFSPSEEIPVDEAEGRICGAVKVPCPPAVPIAASGEIIDRSCINIFKTYGISSVIVVK
ncbi:MAG: aminotransferase class V-fold PLP-dependent enzyme [Ruminococcus sp.]|nr:aminotransferase class V-fold PLP-dependent enzyme [Ruminococcus sp.]